MSSLDLYRALVPAHVDVDSALITTWLGIAARRHPAAAWGIMFPEAMVWWTAHMLETVPGTGAGSSSATEVGTITSQRDGDLSRTYAQPASSSWDWAGFSTTTYGLLYLDLLRSRAVTAPRFVGVGTSSYPYGWYP